MGVYHCTTTWVTARSCLKEKEKTQNVTNEVGKQIVLEANACKEKVWLGEVVHA